MTLVQAVEVSALWGAVALAVGRYLIAFYFKCKTEFYQRTGE